MTKCFWSACSNSRRCYAYGACVAQAQRDAIMAGDFLLGDDEIVKRVAHAIRLADTTDEFAMARAAIKTLGFEIGE